MFYPSVVLKEIGSSDLLCFRSQSFLKKSAPLSYYVLHPIVFKEIGPSDLLCIRPQFWRWVILVGDVADEWGLVGGIKTVPVFSHAPAPLVLAIRPASGQQRETTYRFLANSHYSILLCFTHHHF